MHDIGANLTSSQFQSDLTAVLERAKAAGVQHIGVTGTSLEGSEKALKLAQSHPDFLYATAGIHPHDAKHWNAATGLKIAGLLTHDEVKMAGEMGLDFERNYSTPTEQAHAFSEQLRIASHFDKPLFLHCRGAHHDFLKHLDQRASSLDKVIVHCFTDGPSEAQAYIERGFYIGVTGWVTDSKRGESLRQALQHIPLDRLLIETDAPYLMPLNKPQSQKRDRNEPAFLKYVAEALAMHYEISAQEIIQTTTVNANRLIRVGSFNSKLDQDKLSPNQNVLKFG